MASARHPTLAYPTTHAHRPGNGPDIIAVVKDREGDEIKQSNDGGVVQQGKGEYRTGQCPCTPQVVNCCIIESSKSCALCWFVNRCTTHRSWQARMY